MRKKYYRRKVRGYHFVGTHLRYDAATATPADGVWLRLPPGAKRPRCCRSGFHASRQATQAAQYRPPGTVWLCYVEVQHVTDNRTGDKFTGRARKIIARMPIADYDRIDAETRTWTEANKRVRAAFRKIMKGRK